VITISALSNGEGQSQALSSIKACYDEDSLVIQNEAKNQNFFPTDQFNSCNDPIFDLDVTEMFISPWNLGINLPGPHCYSEIDISPWNVMYISGIYNPNLNHTGCVNSEISCDKSEIKHKTTIEKNLNQWTSTMRIPWKVINAPSGCPADDIISPISTVYRVNFYRINELVNVSTSTCSSTDCEYLAWSPTNVNPPAFHEPTEFGYLILL